MHLAQQRDRDVPGVTDAEILAELLLAIDDDPDLVADAEPVHRPVIGRNRLQVSPRRAASDECQSEQGHELPFLEQQPKRSGSSTDHRKSFT